jgi:tRNA-modifying protein YgfZ
VTGYQALRERAAWIDLSARGKIRMKGEDRARLLHAMCTNQIEKLQPGEGCYAFFLNAQGRILADANILCFADSFLIDTEPETRASLFEHLDRYIIADDVTIEDQTGQLATIAIEGPEAEAVLRAAGTEVPDQPYAWRAWSNRTVARISSTFPLADGRDSDGPSGPLVVSEGSGARSANGFFIFLPPADLDYVTAMLDIPQASDNHAMTVRVENGRPRYGVDINDRRLVQETGQLQAVNFFKGCYLGQEIVERVHSRGQVHRLLRRIAIETLDPPALGTKTEDLEMASAVYSPALQKTVALAYIRRELAEPGTQLDVNGTLAIVLSESPRPPET